MLYFVIMAERILCLGYTIKSELRFKIDKVWQKSSQGKQQGQRYDDIIMVTNIHQSFF